MTPHDCRVSRSYGSSPVYTAICSCGWTGEGRWVLDIAEDDEKHHLDRV